MIKHLFIPIAFLLISIHSIGQQYLELIETNVAGKEIGKYIDAYSWTKNGYLVGNSLPDTLKGGNTIGATSKLNLPKLDSLSKTFSGYLPQQVMRSGQLLPRIVFSRIEDIHPYFLTTLYKFEADSISLIGQFKVLFDESMHNNMPDLYDILVFDPEFVHQHSPALLKKERLRKPTSYELEMTPPPVQHLIP